jgi:hypothetical protein
MDSFLTYLAQATATLVPGIDPDGVLCRQALALAVHAASAANATTDVGAVADWDLYCITIGEAEQIAQADRRGDVAVHLALRRRGAVQRRPPGARRDEHDPRFGTGVDGAFVAAVVDRPGRASQPGAVLVCPETTHGVMPVQASVVFANCDTDFARVHEQTLFRAGRTYRSRANICRDPLGRPAGSGLYASPRRCK